MARRAKTIGENPLDAVIPGGDSEAGKIVSEVKQEMEEVGKTAKKAVKTAKKAANLAKSKVKSGARKAKAKAVSGGVWLRQTLADELRYAADWLTKKDKPTSAESLLVKAANRMLKKLRKKHNEGKEFGPK